MKWIRTSSSPVKTELASGEWYIILDEKGFYISNFDIHLPPAGIGVTEQEAFENMLTRIAEYEQKLKQVRSEIQEHLAELKGEKHEHDCIG